MNEKTQKKIDSYFDKLTGFINQLRLNEKGRNYIWMDSFCKFYDMPIQAEDGSSTYGIQSEWQLKRFEEQFNSNLKKLRLKGVQNWSAKLKELAPSEAMTTLTKQVYSIRQKELLAEIGGQSLNDWDRWLGKYLENEKAYHEIRPGVKAAKNAIEPAM